jgi:hypothetical protein
LHELYHGRFRHPFQLLILTTISECLIFLPLIKGLVQHYKVWMELLADRFAIYRMGSEIPLAHVLLFMLRNNPVTDETYGVHIARESVNYRLKQLINPQTKINIPLLELKTLIPSILILVMMTSMFIISQRRMEF